MTSIICNLCDHQNSMCVKCENCGSSILDNNHFSTIFTDLENDFRLIEEAELNGNICKLEDMNDDIFDGLKQDDTLTQGIKEEPEFLMDVDTFLGVKKIDTTSNVKNTEAISRFQYPCDTCNKSFKRESTLKAHIRFGHNQSDLEEKDKIKQSKKPESKSRNDLETTNNNEIDPFKIKFANGSEGFKCDLCNATLCSKSVLKKHISKIHNSNSSSEKSKKVFTCCVCSERFLYQVELTNHKKTHVEFLKQIEESAIIRRKNTRIVYICKICNKESTDKSRHTVHYRTHSNEKPYKCSMCESSFSTKSGMKTHQSLHTNERPFKCNICEETYRHRKSLKRHLNKHTGLRPFKCSYCDKTFSLKFIKIDHERTVHTRETPYQCEVCGDKFTTSLYRNTHKRNKHNIDTNKRKKVEILLNKPVLNNSVPEFTDVQVPGPEVLSEAIETYENLLKNDSIHSCENK